MRRYQNEAEAVALLNHPGVVAVHEVGDHDGQHYFSMKLVPGGRLASQLERYKDDLNARRGWSPGRPRRQPTPMPGASPP